MTEKNQNKPITFRPTEKSKKAIENLMEKYGYDVSKAIKYSLETSDAKEYYIEQRLQKLESVVREELANLRVPVINFVRQLEKSINSKKH